jgi:hypothetical protein
MLYLAIILIAVGLIFVLVPVFSSCRKDYDSPENLDFSPDPNKDKSNNFVRVLVPLQDTKTDNESFNNKSYEEVNSGIDNSTKSSGILKELEVEIDDMKNTEPLSAKDVNLGTGDECTAVLFEDSSGIIDYENGLTTIDPSLSEYKNLKRIGRGRFEIAKEGINFFVGKSFFRFDFYKIENAWAGKNFIAIFLKGSSVVRLFLFENDALEKNRIKKDLEKYLRSIK